ncbi:hypothetical protein TL16_g12459 [Triparma laevis f. inornata]|uniref:PHD-type domain-containing protein n=2 Tax=Triparma laevis TaxID=1534972 RepID=A0A9W6ZAD1_9STRA|nr:hypothetical protein TrLO_g5456 [Triparma laevis f. longispina]GMH92813.1 hypothetical protein TL16_g12459 [Triparma laevis f. inornata]
MVSAKIPPWRSYPSIDDEIDDLYEDETLQAKIPPNASKTYAHLSGIHLLPNPSGFKACQIPSSVSFNVLNTFKTYKDLGNEEWTKFGRRREGGKILKVSVRLGGSSSRTHIIDHEKIHRVTNQSTSLPTNPYPIPPPNYTATATFPAHLRSLIKPPNFLDRKNSNRFQLEDKATWNNNLMSESSQTLNNKLVFSTYKNPKHTLESQRQGSLAVYKKASKSGREIVSMVNGYRLKNAQHKKPLSCKVVIRLNDQIIQSPLQQFPPSLTKKSSGTYNTLVSISRPDSITSSQTSLKTYTEKFTTDPGYLRYEGSLMCPPLLTNLVLDDGPIKTICLKGGTLLVNDLNRFEKSIKGFECGEEERKCVICDVSEDADQSLNGKVYKCAFCNITCHLDCCYDTGMVGGVGRNKFWLCAVCEFEKNHSEMKVETVTSKLATQIEAQQQQQTPQQSRTSTTPPSSSTTSSEDPEKLDAPKRAVRASRLIQTDADGQKKIPSPPPNYKRPSHNCILCYHTGGAMSPYTDPNLTSGSIAWVHEICRVWSINLQRPSSNADVEKCALCGVVEGQGSGSRVDDVMLRRLARCGHKDCMVSFHPMCAKIGSKQMRERMEKEIEEEEREKPKKKKTVVKMRKERKLQLQVCSPAPEEKNAEKPKRSPTATNMQENQENSGVLDSDQIESMLEGMSEEYLREARKKAVRNKRERQLRKENAEASGKEYSPKLWTQALPNVPDEVLIGIHFERGANSGYTLPTSVVLENPAQFKNSPFNSTPPNNNTPPSPHHSPGRPKKDKPAVQMTLGGNEEPDYVFELEKDGYDEYEWDKIRKNDLMCCSDWTLRMASVDFGRDSWVETEEEEKQFPVVFCGLHNPDRDEGLKGWPAGGASEESGHCFEYPTRTPPPQANEAVDKWAGLFAKNKMIQEKRRKNNKDEFVEEEGGEVKKVVRRRVKKEPKEKKRKQELEKEKGPKSSKYDAYGSPNKKAKKGEEGWDSAEEELELEMEILREAQMQEAARKEMKNKRREGPRERREGGVDKRGRAAPVATKPGKPTEPVVNPDLNEETVTCLKALIAVNTNSAGGSAVFKSGISSLEDALVGLAKPELEEVLLEEVRSSDERSDELGMGGLRS